MSFSTRSILVVKCSRSTYGAPSSAADPAEPAAPLPRQCQRTALTSAGQGNVPVRACPAPARAAWGFPGLPAGCGQQNPRTPSLPTPAPLPASQAQRAGNVQIHLGLCRDELSPLGRGIFCRLRFKAIPLMAKAHPAPAQISALPTPKRLLGYGVTLSVSAQGTHQEKKISSINKC